MRWSVIVLIVVLLAVVAVFAMCKKPPTPANPTKLADLSTPQRLVLEIDRTADAAAVPSSVTRQGKTHTMATIFAPANLKIDEVSDPALPAHASGVVRDAELQTFHQTAASVPTGPNDWYVHGIVLKTLEDSSIPGTPSGVLGLMFMDVDRRSFAVFSGASNIGESVFRTQAHELGHALNLFHNDGDGVQRCCQGLATAPFGFSIMNQSMCLDVNWKFELCPPELDHLRLHPIDAVRPGGKPFGDCNGTHKDNCT